MRLCTTTSHIEQCHNHVPNLNPVINDVAIETVWAGPTRNQQPSRRSQSGRNRYIVACQTVHLDPAGSQVTPGPGLHHPPDYPSYFPPAPASLAIPAAICGWDRIRSPRPISSATAIADQPQGHGIWCICSASVNFNTCNSTIQENTCHTGIFNYRKGCKILPISSSSSCTPERMFTERISACSWLRRAPFKTCSLFS